MPSYKPLLNHAITLIEERTGINRRVLQRAGVTELLTRVANNDLANLLAELQRTNENNPMWQVLIHSLTIGETYFLRDKRHFKILRENLLPELIQQRREAGDLHLNIWCAGCATGEEPYSIAITLHEFLPDIDKWQINILGSDLNLRAIEAAREAIYRPWSFRHTPDDFQQRYFETNSENAILKPHIRQMVTFQQANILYHLPMPDADITFCRNVLMYLSPKNVQRAEQTLFRAMAPGGWLLLGQAEALRSQRDQWQMHIFPGTPIYQKPGANQHTSNFRIHIEPKADDTPVIVPHRPRSSYQDAVAAIHQDDYAEAEHHLANLLTDQPKNPQAHALLAYIFANRQAYPEARAHIRAALNDDPLLVNAHYINAMIHIEHEMLAEAIQALQAVLYSERENALASFTLGSLYTQTGDLPKAYRAWRNAHHALENRPEDDYVSDLSDMTVQTLRGLLEQRLEKQPDENKDKLEVKRDDSPPG